jgi:hypothetical protein
MSIQDSIASIRDPDVAENMIYDLEIKRSEKVKLVERLSGSIKRDTKALACAIGLRNKQSISQVLDKNIPLLKDAEDEVASLTSNIKILQAMIQDDESDDDTPSQPYLLVLKKRIQDALDNEISLKHCIAENNRKMARASDRTLPMFKERAESFDKSLNKTRIVIEQRRKELQDFLQA